jgi:hypothetical protein
MDMFFAIAVEVSADAQHQAGSRLFEPWGEVTGVLVRPLAASGCPLECTEAVRSAFARKNSL